jgi:hypothetical protein
MGHKQIPMNQVMKSKSYTTVLFPEQRARERVVLILEFD